MCCDGSPSLSPSSISALYAKMNLLLKKGDAVLEFGLPVHHASNADYGVCTAQSIDTATCRLRYDNRGIAALAGPQIGGPDHATPLLGTRSNSRGERLPPTLSLFFSDQPPDDR